MIVGYVRVSTQKQHPENQIEEINRYAKTHDYKIDKWVIEIISGKKGVKGRKLGNLIKKLNKGDTIITTEISRISRSLTDIMAVMGQCLERGINILTTKEKYRFDDSINSKVLCFAFGLVAEIEHNLISLRTKEALAARKAEGKALGRRKGNTPKTDILREHEAIISDMKNNGASDKEIYSSLGVSKTTYYKYKSLLLEEADSESATRSQEDRESVL